MTSTVPSGTRQVPTYCYNCVSGPDLLSVKVTDGVATEIGPNFSGVGMHPADGKPCVKAYGLIQKTYNPSRILTPMKRTNPNKGGTKILVLFPLVGMRHLIWLRPSSTIFAPVG